MELPVVVEQAPGVDLRDGPRVTEGLGDRRIVVRGRESAEMRVTLDQIRMRGDREQLGIDQRDQLLEVSVDDERPPLRGRLVGEVRARVDVRTVEFVNAPDRVVEPRLGEESAIAASWSGS